MIKLYALKRLFYLYDFIIFLAENGDIVKINIEVRKHADFQTSGSQTKLVWAIGRRQGQQSTMVYMLSPVPCLDAWLFWNGKDLAFRTQILFTIVKSIRPKSRHLNTKLIL